MIDNREVWIDYTNYKGERKWRHIIPRGIMFCTSDWHPDLQWVIYATDLDKDQPREFALKDIRAWRSTAPIPSLMG
jgi:predicted DNA-binding transcriptional regulator YafY